MVSNGNIQSIQKYRMMMLLSYWLVFTVVVLKLSQLVLFFFLDLADAGVPVDENELERELVALIRGGNQMCMAES